ncbi:MAG: DUF6093 family protein [Longimonas sp.]|uniref:DUF6093 family protein n=1 Tax=Longimonas sp. TaxID=2039626 RepID=UPI0033624E37
MLSYAQKITVETPPTTDGLGREGELSYVATTTEQDQAVTTQVVDESELLTTFSTDGLPDVEGDEATFVFEDPGQYEITLAQTALDTTVYDGAADVQEGAVERVDRGGQTFRVGDAEAFLPRRVPGIDAGQAVTITWADDSTQAATVAEKRRLDDSLVLTYDD